MPIEILLPPEPYAPESRRKETIVIRSAGYRQLHRELLRYCKGEVEGRSFLISGHRGAGKTTMVNDCVLQVEKMTSDVEARPIIVRLHGPNLVRMEEDEPEHSTNGNGNGNGAAPKEVETWPELKAVQLALKQITLSLHRAIVNELTRCYRERVDEEVNERLRNELYEHTAKLELATDQYPMPAELREYWRAGGFLQRGVLFSNKRRPQDQGFRELVALASVSQAYARVTGILKSELSQSSDSLQRTTVGTGKTAVDAIAPITSILTGGLTGTALFAGASQGIVTSALTGLFTAVGAAGVFKVSSVRSRKRTFSSGLTFLPDLRVSTLDRVLPVLIDRIRNAGLVPVFVVDELDKIPGLYGELEGIVKHVKNIVAERAFFCFLTDRNYYERVVQVNVMDPYPKHYTYYTDRVFVSPHTDDLHQYLGDILKPASPANATATAPAPSNATTPAPAPITVSTAAEDEDRRDLEILHYVVLRRSEMHAIELRRQLAVWRDVSNSALLNTVGVRSYAPYRFDLLVQFAIELILHREEVADRMRHDPALGRLLFDALYYPVRMLSKKENGNAYSRFELALDDDASSRFAEYLVDRMNSDKEDDALEMKLKSEGKLDLPELGLEGVDVDFLYTQVRDLVAMIADPFALMDELASDKNRMHEPSDTILQALPLNPATGPLLRRTGDRKYEWRYGANWSARDDLVRSGRETRRSALAWQIDLYINLGVRLALASQEAKPLVGDSDQLKKDLHTNVVHFLREKWLSGTYEFAGSDLIPVLWNHPDALKVIEVLGKILSDHNDYLPRLGESGLRERYEAVRSTFSIRHAPPLATLADMWSFQYDRDGKPRAANLETAYWADLTGAWEQNLDYIRALMHVLGTLRSLTPQSTEAPLDPGYLSVSLGVLRTSPSWRDVEPAVNRLYEFRKSHKFYSKFDEDAATIASYVGEVLLPGRGAFANAIFAGAIVGRAGTSNLHDAVVKGLDVLSSSYWSAGSAAEPVELTLERISSLLEHRWPALQPMREKLRAQMLHPDTDPKDQATMSMSVVREFSELLQKVVQFGQDERAAFITAAWEEWRQHFARSGYQPFTPAVDNLLCRAAQVGPAVQLTDKPNSMTLVQWSDAFFRASVAESPGALEFAPPWLGIVARSALGLRTRPSLASDLMEEVPGAFTGDELKGLALNDVNQLPTLTRVLIVRAPSSSATVSWSIPGGYGVLALMPKQLEQLAAVATKRNQLALPDMDHVFIEAGAESVVPVLERGYMSRWKKRPPLIALGQSNQPADWAARVVPRATSALDLVRTADAKPVTRIEDLPLPIAGLWSAASGTIGQVETTGADHLIAFNLRAAPNGAKELLVRSRSGNQEASLAFAKGRLVRTGLFIRRRYRVTYDSVTVRLEQESATLTQLDSLIPRILISWLVTSFAGKDSVEIAPSKSGEEWQIEYRRRPAFGTSSAANEKVSQALLIVRSTKSMA